MSGTLTELKQKKRIRMMAEGPIARTLFKLSAPAVAGMIVMAIYNIVDTVFVSFLRDTTAIAATGIVFPMFQLIGAVGLTFGMGAASVISRRLGAGDHEGAHRAATTAFYSSLAVGIVLSVLGGIFIQPLLRVFGATPAILAEATLYGRVIIGGSVFLVEQHDPEQSSQGRRGRGSQQSRADGRCRAEHNPRPHIHFCAGHGHNRCGGCHCYCTG